MFLDSQITDMVLTVATNFELPVLGVHDSFIVAQEEVETLLHIIEVNTRELLGQELPVEVSDPSPAPVRSLGYLARQWWHEQHFNRESGRGSCCLT